MTHPHVFRPARTASSLIVLLGITAPAQALVMCTVKKANGEVRDGAPIFLRQACRPRELQLNVTDLGPEVSTLTSSIASNSTLLADRVAALENRVESGMSGLDSQIAAANTSLTSVNSNIAKLNSERVSYEFQGDVNTYGPDPADPTKTITINPELQTSWQFIGPTTTINSVAGKKVIGTGVAVLGTSNPNQAACNIASKCDIGIDLCYQFQNKSVQPFSPTLWVRAVLDKPYVPLPVTDNVSFGTNATGPVAIGYCAKSNVTFAGPPPVSYTVKLNANDVVSGIVTLVNAN